MSEAGFNQAYFEHRIACEPSSSTAPKLSVCILLISWEGLCPCQDTVLWWVPRSALKWSGSGPGHGVTLLGVAHRQNRHLHRAQGMWEQVTLCNSLQEAVQAWMSCSELQLFKHKKCSFICLWYYLHPVWHVCDMRAKGAGRDFACSKSL